MSSSKPTERGRQLRRETAERLDVASFLVRTGEYDAASELLTEKAKNVDCEICEMVLRGAAGGVAFAALPVEVTDSGRTPHVADQLSQIASHLHPGDEPE
jgi:hypothetical protein